MVVPDTLAALGQMARHWRRQFALPVIGVTGSNGKTTVKEMIAAILAAAYGAGNCLATRGNLNNDIGVPLTLFDLNTAQRAAVVELGMNHPGEIGALASIALPTVGLVNNAQREHQEFMPTVEAVAAENGAVLRALPADGIAVFPADDAFTALWRGYAQEQPGRRILSFGLEPGADIHCTYRAERVRQRTDDHGRGPAIPGAAGGGRRAQRAQCAGGDRLRRGDRHRRRGHPARPRGVRAGQRPPAAQAAANGASVIDDSYNANPDSVRAAIDVLAQAASPRILVLGDMGEVGSEGQQLPPGNRRLCARLRDRPPACAGRTDACHGRRLWRRRTALRASSPR